jgi:hypothetical protein
VKREVWLRDRGRCTFVGPSGHRCRERRYVQFDHGIPFMHGGPPTAGNIRLLCAIHNRHEAAKDAARFTRPGTGDRAGGIQARERANRAASHPMQREQPGIRSAWLFRMDDDLAQAAKT